MEGIRILPPEAIMEARLSYPEREHVLQTTLSDEARMVKRFQRPIYPGYSFPYEGNLYGHSVGTLIRGEQIRSLERTFRAKLGLPDLEVSDEFAALFELEHDLGELGEQGDIPHGAKNELHRQIEARQFRRNAALTRHLPTYAKLLRIQEISEQNGDSVEGRLWKLSEHIGFLEIARRIYRRELLGEVVIDAEENERGVYVCRTDDLHENGEEVVARYRKPHTIVYDITKNSLEKIIAYSGEFPTARHYLAKHREELRRMNDVFLSNPDDIGWFQTELRRLDDQLPDHSVAYVLERHDVYATYLRTVTDPALPVIEAEYTPLEPGLEVEITIAA